MRLATAWAVVVAGFLIAIKAAAWILTGSISILGSLIDSLMDVFASAVNFFAVRHALTPPDSDHRFGHGKAEALAGLAQFALMSGSAFFLLLESINRLLKPQDLDKTEIGVVVIIASMVLTLGLVTFQKYVVRRTGSLAVSADEYHYRGDILMNGAVLVALGLSAYGGFGSIDALLGLGIAAYLGYIASKIMRRAYDELMDKEFDDEEREKILDIVKSDADVYDIHDLRTRQAGLKKFIQFHLELDPNITLIRAHEIADRVEANLLAHYPEADIIIHEDPAGLESVSTLEMT
jgi:ferrous-iron efflux pump FieF